MKVEQVGDITSKSNELLRIAERLAERAATFTPGSSERDALEKEIEALVAEARDLTQSAQQEINKYK